MRTSHRIGCPALVRELDSDGYVGRLLFDPEVCDCEEVEDMSGGRYKWTLHAGDEQITMKLKSKIGDVEGLISEIRSLALNSEQIVMLAKLLEDKPDVPG